MALRIKEAYNDFYMKAYGQWKAREDSKDCVINVLLNYLTL